ncbi:MAG: MarR family winged helix-turn-helix transcriptional regulator [Gemmatimonadaceae bacterium]
MTAPKRRTPAGDAVSLLAVQVLRLAGLLIDAGDTLAAPAGQTSARWRVLATIEEEPATVAAIARALGQARQSVQRVADLLAADGLAEYDDNPDDRRAMLVRLTTRGRSTLRAIQAAQRGWADALGAAVGERELRAASVTLARLTDALASRA